MIKGKKMSGLKSSTYRSLIEVVKRLRPLFDGSRLELIDFAMSGGFPGIASSGFEGPSVLIHRGEST